MKKILLILLPLLFITGCGTAESVGFFLGGLESGVQLAKATTEDINKQIQDANEVSMQLEKSTALLKEMYATMDPNEIALLAELVGADPNQAESIITGVIETYNNTHGAVATVKDKAKQPSYWIALILGITAAYQKYKRKTA